jgi:hypothetical protein
MRRHYYVTPSSYLQLIKLYKTMLEERKDKLNQKKNRICNGLQVRFIGHTVITWGHAVALLVEALRYKPERRGFDSRWCHWNFSLT